MCCYNRLVEEKANGYEFAGDLAYGRGALSTRCV